MKLIRHVHACVEIVKNGKHIFIDPSEYGVPKNLSEAFAILITHAHFDHVSIKDVKKCYMENNNIEVYGPKSFAEKADFPVTEVKDEDVFIIENIKVEVVGNFQDIANLNDPPIENIGYIID